MGSFFSFIFFGFFLPNQGFLSQESGLACSSCRICLIACNISTATLCLVYTDSDLSSWSAIGGTCGSSLRFQSCTFALTRQRRLLTVQRGIPLGDERHVVPEFPRGTSLSRCFFIDRYRRRNLRRGNAGSFAGVSASKGAVVIREMKFLRK